VTPAVISLEFILRHQKKLKKLELLGCAINVGKIFGPPHCYCDWADIYKRLANALTGLVELKMEFELKEDQIPYVYSGYSSYGYLKEDELKRRAPDGLTLEEIQDCCQGPENGWWLGGFDRDVKSGWLIRWKWRTQSAHDGNLWS
jgi:hypothetical protein